eukprot:7557651-Pyramimonas_sp.AAC.1
MHGRPEGRQLTPRNGLPGTRERGPKGNRNLKRLETTDADKAEAYATEPLVSRVGPSTRVPENKQRQ